MVTSFVIVFILVDAFFITVFVHVFIVRLIVFTRLKLASFLITSLELIGSKALSLIAHLVIHSCCVLLTLFFVDLLLLSLLILLLELVDDVFLLVPSLLIFQVVKVKLVFQVVNVGILFNVHAVETLEVSLQTLIFFLVFRFHVFKTLGALLSSFQFLASSANLVLKFGFVLTELLHSVFHLVHLASLSINDVTDALFNVLLL